MAKIFDWLKPTGNVSTNAFDVSKRTTFSMPCANLECPLIRVASPKYKGEISLNNSVINTRPMVNQPFNRGQFVLDFYQVPFKQIMSRFDEFYTQLQEGFSSSDNLDNNPQLPHVDLWTLTSMMAHDYLLVLLVNGSYHAESEVYHLDWNSELIPDSTLASYLILGVDVHGIPRCYGMFRLLDLMGYGNYYLAFKEFALQYATTSDPLPLLTDYRPVAKKFMFDYMKFIFNKFIDGDGISQAYYDAVDDFFEHGYAVSQSAYDNAMNLNAQNLSNFGVSDGLGPRLCPNILAFYAYQKVFADIYRNSFYDKSNRFAFNADDICNNDGGSSFVELLSWLHGTTQHGSENWSKHIEVFELRYRQFKKDMFTSLLPNSQFGEVSSVNVGDSVFNLRVTDPEDGTGTNSLFVSQKSNVAGSGKVGIGSSPIREVNFSSNNLTFSVLMQRRAEALQKYKERYLRAGNRMRDQYISSFGKVPYYLEDKYVRYLGSIDSRLNVQGVPATSDTGDYTVGERGSYGYAGINGKINFTCDDWSFIVGIFYYLPEVDYQSFGIEACHKFSEFQDYIVPEFENVGLEPVYRTTLSALATQVAGIPSPVGGERVIGYGPSYMYFKTDVDKVHGEFGSTNELNGVFHNWVTTRGNVSMSELSDYYVRPDYLNSVMQQGYTGGQDTDPFLCVLDFDYKNIVPLSVVGLPIWD